MASSLRLDLQNDLGELARCRPQVAGFLESIGASETTANDLYLVLEELVSNIVRHGYPDGRAGTIHVVLEAAADRIVMSFQDDGAPFDPSAADVKPLPTTIAELPTGGYGLRLVRALTRDVRYRRLAGHNLLDVTLRPSTAP